MHRTYSMRQSRAPTASQLENPPPQTSSTKNRLFGKTHIGKWSWLCRLSASPLSRLHCITTEGHRCTLLVVRDSWRRQSRYDRPWLRLRACGLNAPDSQPTYRSQRTSFLLVRALCSRVWSRCRTCLPQISRWRLRPRFGKEALAARKDGEERYA